MNRKGLLLAGALVLVPIAAPASSELPRHPAVPTGHASDPVHESPFAAGVPVLDRDAPQPSNWPIPAGESPDQPQAESVEHEGMDHSGMHGTMQGGASGSTLLPSN